MQLEGTKMHVLNRISLILLFSFLPSSVVLAGDMGFVATTLPISLNQARKARTFDQISRKISRIIAHVGVATATKLKIPGVSFREVNIPCPSDAEFEHYLNNDTKDCPEIGKLIALTAPRNRSGLVRFFHEKRDQEGGVYVRRLAQQQYFGAVIRSFWVLYGNASDEIANLGEKEMNIEISVAGYMPDSNAEQITDVMIKLDENMKFSGEEMIKDLEPKLTEIFTNLLERSKMMHGEGFAEVSADVDF